LNLGRNLVHPCLSYTFFFWNTQISEYLCTTTIFGLIRHAGHDEKVYMGMVFMFCKLNHISLDTARDFFEGDRDSTH